MVNGVRRWLVPVIAYIITDWPEGQCMSLIKAGATSSFRNCRVCYWKREDAHDTLNAYRAKKRTTALTKALRERYGYDVRITQARRDIKEKKYGQFFNDNGLDDAQLYSPTYGVHAILPPDTLHTMSKGMAELLRTMLQKIMKKEGTFGVFDRRLAQIPVVRDPDQRQMPYRRYRTGIHNMKVYTADDMLALLQQMHYAVGTGNTVIPQEAVRNAFISACVALVKMVVILKKRVVKEAELVFFDEKVKGGAPPSLVV